MVVSLATSMFLAGERGGKGGRGAQAWVFEEGMASWGRDGRSGEGGGWYSVLLSATVQLPGTYQIHSRACSHIRMLADSLADTRNFTDIYSEKEPLLK
jgi:hypothetical protein